MAEQKPPGQQHGQSQKGSKKQPGMGERAKDVLKDEAVRAASWEARSFFHRIFGHNIGRIIRKLFR